MNESTQRAHRNMHSARRAFIPGRVLSRRTVPNMARTAVKKQKRGVPKEPPLPGKQVPTYSKSEQAYLEYNKKRRLRQVGIDKDNLFQDCSKKISSIGETTIIVSLEKEYGGNVHALINGHTDSLVFAMATILYNLNKEHGIPLKVLGERLNKAVSLLEKLDKENCICDKAI